MFQHQYYILKPYVGTRHLMVLRRASENLLAFARQDVEEYIVSR